MHNFISNKILINSQLVLVQDVKERCEELFAVVGEDFDASQILQPELSAVVPPATSFSDIVYPKTQTIMASSEDLVMLKDSGKQDTILPHSLALIGALVVLLIAMLLALFMLK